MTLTFFAFSEAFVFGAVAVVFACATAADAAAAAVLVVAMPLCIWFDVVSAALLTALNFVDVVTAIVAFALLLSLVDVTAVIAISMTWL